MRLPVIILHGDFSVFDLSYPLLFSSGQVSVAGRATASANDQFRSCFYTMSFVLRDFRTMLFPLWGILVSWYPQDKFVRRRWRKIWRGR